MNTVAGSEYFSQETISLSTVNDPPKLVPRETRSDLTWKNVRRLSLIGIGALWGILIANSGKNDPPDVRQTKGQTALVSPEKKYHAGTGLLPREEPLEDPWSNDILEPVQTPRPNSKGSDFIDNGTGNESNPRGGYSDLPSPGWYEPIIPRDPINAGKFIDDLMKNKKKN